MRIGQITGEYPPMQGGVGAFTQELSRALAAQGHEIFVFTDHRAAPPAVNGTIQVTADAHSWRWGTLGRIRRWVDAHKLDVVNIQYQAAAYNMSAYVHILPMRLDGVAVVTTFHDLLVPYLFPKAGPLRYQAVLTLARSSDGVIVTNSADYDRMRSARTAHDLQHIPIGSNITPAPPPGYSRDLWRAALEYQPDDIVVGYFGFLNASKGIDTLLQGVKIARGKGLPVRLLMIGGRTGTSDPTNVVFAQEVEELIDQLELAPHVKWTGFEDAEQVSGHLMAVDLLALPYRDGVSFRRGSLMAGLAHGCAIITTHPEFETPELEGGRVARLIPPDSPTALAVAIEDLGENPELRASMGRDARELAAEFTWDKIAERTARFFGDLLAHKHA